MPRTLPRPEKRYFASVPGGLQEAPTVAPLDAPAPLPSPATRSRFEGARENLILLAVSLIAFAALALLLEAISVHSNTPNSDGATVILEGQSMANGHLALHGWALSLDSFWTVDAAIYMVVIGIVGVQGEPALCRPGPHWRGGYRARRLDRPRRHQGRRRPRRRFDGRGAPRVAVARLGARSSCRVPSTSRPRCGA